MQSSNVAAADQATAAQYNVLREDIARNGGDYATAGGTADALTLSIDAEYDSYVAGDRVKLKAASNNTGAATINVNSLGVKSVKDVAGNALQAKAIRANQIIELVYDGTDFLLISASFIGTAKGSIEAYSGDGAKVELPAGNDGQVVGYDSAETSGLKAISVGSLVHSDYTQAITTNNGSDVTLISWTVPGGTLGTSNALRLTAYCSDIDGGGSSHQFKLKYGSTVIATGTTTSNLNSKGKIEAILEANGSTSAQKGVVVCQPSASDTFVVGTGTAGAEDSTGDLTVSLIINGGSSADVTFEAGFIEFIPGA